ncbi:subtilisin-like protein [Mycena olivaceomarginata]|nr:subtilisin-like protein [Mycena olivaceomarginata]
MPFRKLANLFTIISASLVVHESRRAAPAGFFSQGAAPVTEVLTLRFGLTPNNLSGLQEKLVSISTPRNLDFRQWLSEDEVKSFVQPSNETVVAFNSFAAANGLKPTVVSPNGDWLSLALTVSQANHLFGAQFEKFSHASFTEPITRTLTISLPSELIGHVDGVHPSTSFAGRSPGFTRLSSYAHRFEKRTEPLAACNSSRSDEEQQILVTGYLGTSPNRTDLSKFLEQFRPDIPPNTTFDLITIDNSTGLATGVPVEFLSVGGPPDSTLSDIATAFLDANTFLDEVDNPPSVVTISFGLMENLFESSVSKSAFHVLFGSGDDGVRGNHDNSSIPGVCESNVFIPVFPASCPYSGIQPEVATNLTGGGFSDLFPRPWYQTQAVDRFLKTIPPDFAGTFNKSGRSGLDMVFNGTTFPSAGTSFSSPIFSSMIALINDRLVAAGKPVLGFLNPFLYANTNTFTDITEGHNSGFECPHIIGELELNRFRTVAFDATKGWDALTGVGSPVFDKLLAAAFEY